MRQERKIKRFFLIGTDVLMQTVDKFSYFFNPYIIYACASHWRHKIQFLFLYWFLKPYWRQKDRMAEVGGHLVQTPAQAGSSRVSYTMPKWLLNVFKDGDFTISLTSMCQCSVIFTVEKCFLMFRWHLQYFSFCPLLLVLSLVTTKKSLAPSSLHSPSGIKIHWAIFY